VILPDEPMHIAAAMEVPGALAVLPGAGELDDVVAHSGIRTLCRSESRNICLVVLGVR
jgi:hypothetical protein